MPPKVDGEEGTTARRGGIYIHNPGGSPVDAISSEGRPQTHSIQDPLTIQPNSFTKSRAESFADLSSMTTPAERQTMAGQLQLDRLELELKAQISMVEAEVRRSNAATAALATQMQQLHRDMQELLLHARGAAAPRLPETTPDRADVDNTSQSPSPNKLPHRSQPNSAQFFEA